MMKRAKISAESPKCLSFTAEQVHAFRLQRHHLLGRPPQDLVTICRDLCGVQAQIMSAAQLQLWARNPAITPAMVNDALWQQRSLVKTSLMRQTLHLIPTEDFPLYIAAHKRSRVKSVLSIMARCNVTSVEADELSALILQALSAGPASRTVITSAVRSKVSKRVRAWMDKVWSIVRLPVFEGLVCYGPGEGNEATFIRTEHWLPAQERIDEVPAQTELLRRYLSAYGPATLKDFAHWSGISMAEVRALKPLLETELTEQNGLLLLRKDVKILNAASSDGSSVHLLPYFDVYLLAHAVKDHFLETSVYKRVYRNQGWVSPVVLIGGKIAGVWTYKLSRQTFTIEVELFGRISPAVRKEIGHQAEALAGFFQRGLLLSFRK